MTFLLIFRMFQFFGSCFIYSNVLGFTLLTLLSNGIGTASNGIRIASNGIVSQHGEYLSTC